MQWNPSKILLQTTFLCTFLVITQRFTFNKTTCVCVLICDYCLESDQLLKYCWQSTFLSIWKECWHRGISLWEPGLLWVMMVHDYTTLRTRWNTSGFDKGVCVSVVNLRVRLSCCSSSHKFTLSTSNSAI